MRIRIDFSSVVKTMGQLLLVEAAMLLIPLTVGAANGDDGWIGFPAAAVVAAVAGMAMWLPRRHYAARIQLREGYLLVGTIWIVFSLVGMIPFMTGTRPLGITDAFFETVSGFTTTGGSVIPDVEACGRGLLLWRAMIQWIGGLGIILFMLAMLPWLNANGGITLYNAETSGITHDKLHPRIRQTAMTLWKVYASLTLILIVALWCGPMSLFDAVCQALSTTSTGGFSTRNASISAWHSDYISLVIAAFMWLSGVNFGLIYSACHGAFRDMLRNDVFRAYCLIVAVVYAILVVDILLTGGDLGFHRIFVEPIFHITAALTSTGFSISDFSVWGPLAVMLTMMMMACGACAGSTSGALKVDRVVALRRNLHNEVKLAIAPKRVFSVRVNGNLLSVGTLRRITAFFTIFIVLILAGTLVTCAFGIGIDDSFFAVISCIGNNGLGYGITNCPGGYGILPDAVKWILSALMITGRLELFSILVLFSPLFWRK